MKCPGQDTQYWKPGAIFEAKCPKCGKEVEFFKDDPTRTCKSCGHRFVNPQMDFGCAAYCPFAEQCVGDLPPELVAQRQDLIKDRVAIEMKRYLKQDFKKIGHATRVARYAERIGKEEEGNLAVILIAAYLHNVGNNETQSIEVAKNILEKLGAPETLVDEVCKIISHGHHPADDLSINHKAVFDAGLIADLEEKQKENQVDSDRIKHLIDTAFLTPSGRKHAEKVLL